MEKVIIIGSGPAGLAAGIYTARANLEPLIIEGHQPGGQLITTSVIENYPGFPEGIAGADLMMAMREQAQRFGARLRSGELTAASFAPQALQIVLDKQETLPARTVIIATGAGALYLGLPSEQALIGRGVSACATCDGALYRQQPVAVVGGGDSALTEALFLTRFASRVTLIHRRDQFRASQVMVERVRQHPKINIILESVVDEVLDVARGEVTGLRLKHAVSGELSELAVAAVFVAIGRRPNSQPFAGQVTMDERGYIITEQTRTNVPGVWAAGDVQDTRYRQAITAAASGCMAALAAEHYLKDVLHE